MVDKTTPRRRFGDPELIGDVNRQKQELEEAQQERADSTSFGEAWDAAKEKNFLFNATERAFERNQYEPQEGYAPSKEDLKPLAVDYNDDELDFVSKAVNPTDFAARQDAITKDREMHQTISDAGWKGVGADILAYMVDPAAIPLMMVTGGAAGAGRVALATRALRAGSVGGAVSGGIEAGLMSTDTQRDWSDVALATVAGGIVSGAMPVAGAGIRRLRGGADEVVDDAAQGARDLDAAIRDDAEIARLSSVADDLQRGIGFQNLTNAPQRQNLIDSLMPQAESRLSGKQRKAVNAKAQKARDQLDALEAQRKALPQLPSGLKGNRLRRATAARKAELDAIEARAATARKQLEEATRRQATNKQAQQAQADIEALQRGEIPPTLKDKYDEMIEAERTPFLRKEAKRVREMAEAAKAAKAEAEELERVAPAEGGAAVPEKSAPSTVGAQQADGAHFWDDTHLVPEEGALADHIFEAVNLAQTQPRAWQNRLLGPRAIRDGLQSTYATLDASTSDAIRGLNMKLNNDAQGVTRGNISSAVYQDMYMRRFLNAEGGAEMEALEDYAKSKGRSAVKTILNIGGARDAFDNEVVLHIRGKVVSTDPNVIKAADARARTFKEALRARKESGVLGYENVTDDPRYWPFLPDLQKMQKSMSAPKYGRQAIEDTLTGAYRNGRFKLSEPSARIVAKAQIERTLNRGIHAAQRVETLLNSTNRKLLEDDFLTAGMDPAQVKNIIDDLTTITEREGIGSRARMSLGASISYRDPASGLRMVDILDTSQEAALGYAREAAGDSAIARQGFKTRRELEDVISLSQKEAENIVDAELEAAKRAGNTKRVQELEDQRTRIGSDVSRLNDTVRQLYSESLDADSSGQVSSAVKVSRGVRKYTGVIRLGWNGFASIAENSNALVNFTMGTTLKNVPATKWFRAGRPGADETLDEMYRVMGAYGHKDSYIINKNQMANNLSEDAQGRLEKMYNNGIGYVADKTMLLSGFRTVQNGGEELALRSMMDRLMRAAKGTLKYTDKDLEHWRQAGLSDTDVDAIFKHINDNPYYITKDGKQMEIFSGEGMAPALRDRMGAAMTSILSRQMQKNFVGDTSIWVNKEIGKLATQFRTFSLVSMEKQLIAGLRGDKVALAQKLAWGSLLAYGAYQARIQMQSATKPASERKKFIDASTQGPALAIGVLNMTSQSGGFGIPLDGLATFGALPDSWMAGRQRWGFRGYGVDSIPAAGAVADVAGAATGGVQFMKAALMGEKMDDEDAERAIKNFYRTLPLMNTAAVGAAQAAIND